MSSELYHFGVKGMKWGVRRYQNKDGSLTAEGKKHVADYKKAVSLNKEIDNRANSLIKSDPRLKRDFGDGTDDPEYLEYIASGYKISTKALRESMANYSDFYKENGESIRLGRKITQKLLKQNARDVYPSPIDTTGSSYEYYRR